MATTIEASVQHTLVNDATVAAITTAMYPGVAPDNADPPYMTYQRISSEHTRHMTGAGGMAVANIQVDCWGTTYAQAKDLAEACRSALDNTEHTNKGAAGDQILVRAAFLESQRDDFTPLVEGDDLPKSHRVIQEWRVWHSES